MPRPLNPQTSALDAPHGRPMLGAPRRRHVVAALVGGTVLGGCAGGGYAGGAGGGWITLLNGSSITNFDGWTLVGKGNWSLVDGTVQGRNGEAGFLVSRDSYTDFDLRAEFWADETCNSGLFLRCQDRQTITADNAYEVNIFDRRPDPSYGTGAIVNVAKAPTPMPLAANRWNLYEVQARGDRLVVKLNGQQTVDARDGRLKSGPLALQSAGGTIRFRLVQIRPL